MIHRHVRTIATSPLPQICRYFYVEIPGRCQDNGFLVSIVDWTISAGILHTLKHCGSPRLVSFTFILHFRSLASSVRFLTFSHRALVHLTYKEAFIWHRFWGGKLL